MPEPSPLELIFFAAMEKGSSQERAAYLDQACAGDPDLRRRIDKMLAAQAQAGSFLEQPALAHGATIDEPNPAQPSMVIGPYKLVEEIGEGGMGTVWMAQQTEPVKRLVALKLIKPGMDSKQVIARFEAERQALALMDHPNIARVLDAGVAGTGRPYFVMELVKGVPITRYCDEHRLTPRERLELFIPVCQAVQHAHQKGIIHRDLKPSNVLVALYDGKPVPKVIDFGVAKATGQQLTEKTLVTGFGAVVGTLEYMSPEQAELNQLDIDTRSDVYALGVLLYELLTGTTPLDRKRLKEAALLEVLRVIREEEPPRPSTRLSTTEELPSVAANRGLEPKRLSGLVRGELDWIVMKALEKDRNRRYGTANGLARDVQRYLADEPVQACPPSAGYRLRKFVRRNKRTVMAAAAMLALVLAGTVASAWQAIRATRAEQRTGEALTRETAARTETREALDALADDVVETLFTRQSELGEKEHAFMRRILGLYDKFTRQSTESAEGSFLRAKAYSTVAHLHASLGEPRDAVANYQQAEALLQQLAAEFPETAEYRYRLARIDDNLGIELFKLGHQPAAESAFRRAVALCTQLVHDAPKDLGYCLQLVTSANDFGAQKEMQHKLNEAEENYRYVLNLERQLVADSGGQPRYRLYLMRGLSNLGQVLWKQTKYAESEQLYREAAKGQEELLAKRSATTQERKWLANSYTGLAIALTYLKRPQEAEEAFRRSLEVRRKLAEDYPSVLAYRRELASNVMDLASFLMRQAKNAAAEVPGRQALALRKAIVAQAGTVPEYRRELADTYHQLGWLLGKLGRANEAEAAWQAALEHWQQLAAKMPDRPDYHNGLGSSLIALAHSHNQRSSFTTAAVLLERARPQLQAALGARPSDPYFRECWRDCLAAVAENRLGFADHVRGAAAALEVARFAYEPADDAYYAAGLLGRCVSLAARDAALPEPKRKELTQSYYRQALALLHQAVAHGFQDLGRLKKDRDLDSIRQSEEFQKILANVGTSHGKK